MLPLVASPETQREGLRSASRTNSTHRTPEDSALISSLRGALRAAIVRLEAHKKRDEELEAERKAMAEEHSAGTTYILTQGCRAADVNGLFVEKELHAWNEEFRTKKDRASSRLAANHRSLGHDLDSILSDVVEKDALILEMYGGAEEGIPSAGGSSEQIKATPDTRKRAREVDSPHAGVDTPSLKRARQSSNTSFGLAMSDGPTRTVNFEDIYQGGKAYHKHAIVTLTPYYPGRWYIVKCECDHHTVHFGGPNSALQGAAKHLNGRYHGMERSYKAAIDVLGWEVLGCDFEKAALNNAAMDEALKHGYVPLSTLTKAGRNSNGSLLGVLERNVSEFIPPPVKNDPITHAVGGELYYAWWPHDGKYYLSMIIPWENSRDFGLQELARGIGGLGLLNKKRTRVPKCYSVDYKSDPPRITNWNTGYEDGGTKMSKRHFPTLFFHPPKNLAAWTEAGHLRPFDWRHPNFDVPGYELDPQFVEMALETFARVKGFSCFDEFKASQGAEGVSGGESSFGGTVPGPVKDGESVFRRPDPLGSDAKNGLGRSRESPLGEVPGRRATSSEPGSDGDTPMDDVSEQLQAEAQANVAAESALVRSRSGSGASSLGQRPPGRDKPGTDQVSGTADSSTVSTAATAAGKPLQSGPVSGSVEKSMATERQPGTGPSTVPAGASETLFRSRPSGLPPKPQHNISTPPTTPAVPGVPGARDALSGLPPEPKDSINPPPIATPASATPGAPRPSWELPTKPPPGVDGPLGINTHFNATNGTQSPAWKSPVQATPATSQPAQPKSSANQAAQRAPSTQPASTRNLSQPTSTPAQVEPTTSSTTANRPSIDTAAAAHESPQPALASTPAPVTKATSQMRNSQAATAAGPPPAVKGPPTSGGPLVTPGAIGNPPPTTSPRVQTVSTPAASNLGLNTTGHSLQPGARAIVSPAGSPAPSFTSTSTLQSPVVKTETVQHFYLSEYEGPDRFWNADTPTDRLILEINPDSATASTLPGQPVSLNIDRSNVTSHNQFRDRPEPGKHTLILKMKDRATGTPKEHRLVFDRGEGVAASRQARRFFSWVTRM